MPLLKFILRLSELGLAAVILTLTAIFGCNIAVTESSESQIFSSVNDIPENQIGVLLGTGKYTYSNNLNRYYIHRISAAAELYHAGKIKYILVSGDNHKKGYNEPEDMKLDLVNKGVPEQAIYLDYAGFRTFDSMVRAKKVFGQDRFTVISQKFHNERAIFIANNKGIEAVGFNAMDVSKRYGVTVMLREKLARVKVFLDLYLLQAEPKFLGDPIRIG